MLPCLITLRLRWGWSIPPESACALEASAAECSSERRNAKTRNASWLLALYWMHCAAAATSFHTRWLLPKALTGPFQRYLQHFLLQWSLPTFPWPQWERLTATVKLIMNDLILINWFYFLIYHLKLINHGNQSPSQRVYNTFFCKVVS